MIDNLIPFTLFGSGIAFGFMLVAMFIVFIITDATENGTAAFFSLLLFIGFNYFWGTFPLLNVITFRHVGIYLTLGFLFSLIRTYFKGKRLSGRDKENFNLKDHVFRWWLMWPISLINWGFGEVLKDFYNFLYSKLEKFYQSIFNSSI